MKHLFRSVGAALLLALPFAALAQTGVTIGASTAPDVSAALDIISTSKGVLLPRVADVTTIASPATGLIVYQTGGTAGYYYNAGTSAVPNWQQLATAAGAAVTASNGLTKTGQDIALGGNLTGPTTIDLGAHNLSLTSSGGNVGIGTTPTARLDVNGSVRLRGLTTPGFVMSDIAGNLFNTAVSGLGASYIQNQTTQQATSNFNISGTGTVGGILTTGAGLVVNSGGVNTGTIANGLRFNGPGAGEGIASKTNAGGNQLGLDFYTNSSARLSITNGGNVGIGTSALPASRLEVNGGLTLTETASTALTGASPAYVIPTNVSTVRLVPDGTTPPTGTVALTSTTPVSGQQLAVYNGTTIPATLNSQTIPAGQAVSFVYSNGGWRASAGQGDNLGNHTATQTLSLGGNALTGTGATIGAVVGVGVRADGGLNLGQNGTNGSVYLGYQAGRLNTGNANVFTGFQSGFANATGGNDNQMTGYQSGFGNTTGSGNVFTGTGAGYTNTTGFNNQFSGYQSGYLNLTGNSNSFGGYQSGYNNTTGGNNIFTGFQSGFTNTAGGNNVFSGFQSGFSNTTITGVSGDNNAFTGFQSGYTNTTGSNNIFTGYESGKLNTTGGSNFFGGYQSGKANTTGGNNQFIGFQSGTANTTGSDNVFSGFQSGTANTTASNNTFIGNQSGFTNTTGTSNIFIGYQAGKLNLGGSNNMFSGFQSGAANAGGSGNVFSGFKSGTANTTGDNNVFSGYQSGLANTTGANNVFIGNLSGQTNTTGGTNTALGYNSGPSTTALTNATALGANAVVSQSNSLVLGASGTSVGIGITAPAKRLHVDANSDFLRVDNLASVSNTNNYLVIDGSGNVGKTTVENVAGQVIRLGFNGGNYFENTTIPADAESALRFSNHASAVNMGNAPNTAPNFINTITGSSIATAQAVAAGNGTRARTTDQITLPAGVYRVTVRLSGSYFVSSASGTVRSGFVKFIVNNNEYSLVETLNAYDNGVTIHSEVSDYLNLSSTSTVDFSVRFLRNFSLIDRLSPGTGNSYRSLLLIERVR